jgi:hypothetical protein
VDDLSPEDRAIRKTYDVVLRDAKDAGRHVKFVGSVLYIDGKPQKRIDKIENQAASNRDSNDNNEASNSSDEESSNDEEKGSNDEDEISDSNDESSDNNDESSDNNDESSDRTTECSGNRKKSSENKEKTSDDAGENNNNEESSDNNGHSSDSDNKGRSSNNNEVNSEKNGQSSDNNGQSSANNVQSSDNNGQSSDNNGQSSDNNEESSDNSIKSTDINIHEGGVFHERAKAADIDQSPHKEEIVVEEFAITQEFINQMRVVVAQILDGSMDMDVVVELLSAVDLMCTSDCDLNPVIRNIPKSKFSLQVVRFLSQIKKLTLDISVQWNAVYKKDRSCFCTAVSMKKTILKED